MSDYFTTDLLKSLVGPHLHQYLEGPARPRLRFLAALGKGRGQRPARVSSLVTKKAAEHETSGPAVADSRTMTQSEVIHPNIPPASGRYRA